jgi:hypothetical protein
LTLLFQFERVDLFVATIISFEWPANVLTCQTIRIKKQSLFYFGAQTLGQNAFGRQTFVLQDI